MPNWCTVFEDRPDNSYVEVPFKILSYVEGIEQLARSCCLSYFKYILAVANFISAA